MEGKLFCETVFFCSQLSRDFGENLHGTASQYRGFILVEYSEPFPKKALDARLDANWLQQTNALAKSLGAKLILIKNGKSDGKSLKIIYVDALRKRWCQYISDAQTYKYFNLALFIDDDETHWHHEPFFIVCTNGKKDKCCAKFGLPIYRAMQNKGDFTVYECTHFGGDRYAGNAVLMPFGVYYGRLLPEQTADLISATKARKILADNYRGTCTMNFAKQSAEFELRKFLEDYHIDFHFQVIAERAEGDIFVFEALTDYGIFDITLRKFFLPEKRLLTCAAKTPNPVANYELIGIVQKS